MQSTSSLPLTWSDWLQKHSAALDAGFEHRFALEVLFGLKSIQPRDVIPQAPWRDADRKARRFDFRIRDTSRGIDIAIELDGATKDTDSERWMKFLDRQNDALLEAGVLLRFSNKKLFKNPSKIIETIERVISAQERSFKDQLVAEQTLTTLRNRIAELTIALTSAESDNSDQSQSALRRAEDELARARGELKIMQERLRQSLLAIPDPLEAEMRPIVYMLGAIAFIAVGAVIFIAVDGKTPQQFGQPARVSLTEVDGNSQSIYGERSASQGVGANYDDKFADIAASNAPLYVGRSVVACGEAVQVNNQPKRSVVNLESPYPRQPLYLLIWRQNVDAIQARVGELSELQGQCVCGVGKVQLYKNMANIEIRNPANLRILTKRPPCWPARNR